jgi:hypothetical protein
MESIFNITTDFNRVTKQDISELKFASPKRIVRDSSVFIYIIFQQEDANLAHLFRTGSDQDLRVNKSACRHGATRSRAANNPLLDRMTARFRGDGGELMPKGPVAARRAIAAPWHASDPCWPTRR